MKKINHHNIVVRVFLLLFLFSSCYEEYLHIPDYKSNHFRFYLTADQEKKLYNSTGEKYELIPTPEMHYGDEPIKLDKLSIRGQSSVNVRRKSFSVNADGNFLLPFEDSTGFYKYEKFKLLAMPFDYTYIENRLSHLLMSEIDLWSLKSFYTEVSYNTNHQGLYLFVEDPEEHLFKYQSAHYVLRRDYDHEIYREELNPNFSSQSAEYFRNKFNHIYSLISQYSGTQLYDSLTHHINIDSYMRKMAFDFIVGNGDSTDEVYFYIVEQNNRLIFEVLPWDYDDLFSSVPHEVGRGWAVGTVFGTRSYSSTNAVLEALNGRLVFSIEDDLDYIITMDDVLYAHYLENLEWVLNRVNTESITSTFEKIDVEITPFYEIPEVSEQSEYDTHVTNYDIYVSNSSNKKQFLIDRVNWIASELNKQKQ